jgi:3-oxoacyl-[acyl-carrier protein] reductase
MILKGKVALITGSSRGIGNAIALTFAREGADVAVNYLNSRELAEATVDKIRSMGRKASAIQADVSQHSQADNLVKSTLDKLHKIDILINCAGIHQDRTLGKMPVETWNEVIAVNLTGTFNCTKAAIDSMREQEYGRIINISSVVGQTGVIGASNYAAAKAGIFGFTKAIAKEVAHKGITVNAMALGYFETGMLLRLSPEIQEDIRRQIPMGRFGRVEEVTQVALFLASDASSYITGQVIHVNGGFYM